LCCPAQLPACGNHFDEAERDSGIGLKRFGFIGKPKSTFIRNPVRDHRQKPDHLSFETPDAGTRSVFRRATVAEPRGMALPAPVVAEMAPRASLGRQPYRRCAAATRPAGLSYWNHAYAAPMGSRNGMGIRER
jgi:hypothetical protein